MGLSSNLGRALLHTTLGTPMRLTMIMLDLIDRRLDHATR